MASTPTKTIRHRIVTRTIQRMSSVQQVGLLIILSRGLITVYLEEVGQLAPQSPGENGYGIGARDILPPFPPIDLLLTELCFPRKLGLGHALREPPLLHRATRESRDRLHGRDY